MSRPVLVGESLFHYAAFQRLQRDRPFLGGMAICPRPIPTAAIEREAHRLDLIGDGYDIFVAVLSAVDDFWLETEMKRMADEANRRAAQQQR